MRINANETAVLVVDYQEKLLPAMSGLEELMDNSKKLLKGLKELGVPMIVTEQYKKGLGPTVPEIAECIGDDFKAYEKLTGSVGGRMVQRMIYEYQNKQTGSFR